MDLDSVVRELSPRLLGYCYLRTGDPSLAEDLTQESLTALVQHWRRYGSPDSPAAFVFAIARRRAARALLRRRLWLPLDRVEGTASTWGDPEASLVVRTERQQLVAALSDLASKDREVILLVTVGELTLHDAAAALGISVSAAKMRALRARRRLRQVMENGDGTE